MEEITFNSSEVDEMSYDDDMDFGFSGYEIDDIGLLVENNSISSVERISGNYQENFISITLQKEIEDYY